VDLGSRVIIVKTTRQYQAVLVDLIPKGESPGTEKAREYFGFPPTIQGYIASPYDRYVFKYLGRAGYLIVPDVPEAASLWRRIIPVKAV
jgi:hypothetical protein